MANIDTLILSPYPERLEAAFKGMPGEVFHTNNFREDASWVPSVDWIVTYGYRSILKKHIIDKMEGRIVNIHIGLLPWNRGADPNFWSWFEDTPKGFSIHQIDKGIDTGPIYYQNEVMFGNDDYNTLATTYAGLHVGVVESFIQIWPLLRDGKIEPVPQVGIGTYHKSADKEQFFRLLSKGYDTPVSEVAAWGRKYRERKQ